ncbi:MAG: tRNA (guanosine(37)-N1)-methyltransferase TrmD [Candidatus Pacebacteria bacterium]|nr:tRNA (guanosine(37)-N1)-methyltransferase TrmD [Candidatus Paceibacterota bacterium]MBP9851424.1 tRNA (guanosine(37)-N1)-methyltransferase TrmD [Candidatus Paceibacterota bacterium]
MRFHIITIFPDIFSSYVQESILGRAIENKKVSIKFYNPRDFLPKTANNYKPVDERPYGGGPGMVMKAEPILKAVEKALSKIKDKKKTLIINFIPSAEKFTTEFAKKVSNKYTDVILICGRYEGIDARVDKILKTKKISIGDYVLTGGELPAMIVVDCVARQIPGVLGKFESLEEERVSTSEVYTRPEILKYKNKNYKVPPVLLSGDHKKIEEWKAKSSKS